jgi:hypothetical protein
MASVRTARLRRNPPRHPRPSGTILGVGTYPGSEEPRAETAAEHKDQLKLPAVALAPAVDPGGFGFADTSELPPLDETIGQERAVEALRFGLEMRSLGFKVYVCGPVGTGGTSLVRQTVRRLAKALPAPPDWCYVNNFQDPSRPMCLSFPSGAGQAFAQAMATLVESLRHDIPSLFESKAYLDARAKMAEFCRRNGFKTRLRTVHCCSMSTVKSSGRIHPTRCTAWRPAALPTWPRRSPPGRNTRRPRRTSDPDGRLHVRLDSLWRPAVRPDSSSSPFPERANVGRDRQTPSRSSHTDFVTNPGVAVGSQ